MSEAAQLQDHKDKAMALLRASAVHDGPGFAALMHPDAIWWTLGKPHLFAASGEKSRDEICAYMATPSIFNGGVEVQFGQLTAEDDRVAVEAHCAGVLPDGRAYTNLYHYLITFREGLVWRVKEYLDTQAAAEYFGGPSEWAKSVRTRIVRR